MNERIQGAKSLRDEMISVAKGETKAPDHAAGASYSSEEARQRPMNGNIMDEPDPVGEALDKAASAVAETIRRQYPEGPTRENVADVTSRVVENLADEDPSLGEEWNLSEGMEKWGSMDPKEAFDAATLVLAYLLVGEVIWPKDTN